MVGQPQGAGKVLPQVASEGLIECISFDKFGSAATIYFSSCCCILSPFCSSAFLEHRGCVVMTLELLLILHWFFVPPFIWRAEKEQCTFLGLTNFSFWETLGTSSCVYTFQVDVRVFKGTQTAHLLSSHCFHGNSAAPGQKHTLSSHMRNAA